MSDAIKTALVSVSDKTGIVEFVRQLRAFHIGIISTGGTAKVLRDAGEVVLDVSSYTGHPEIMDGRIKTLHSKIMAGILANRDIPDHISVMDQLGYGCIDMVVCNLYPFEQTIAKEGVRREEAIEQIDIGGPTMIRAAAKNFKDVVVVVKPEHYGQVMEQLHDNHGNLPYHARIDLACVAFETTAAYDAAITKYYAQETAAARLFHIAF